MQWVSHLYMPAATKAAKAALDFSNNQLSKQFLIETSCYTIRNPITATLQRCNIAKLKEKKMREATKKVATTVGVIRLRTRGLVIFNGKEDRSNIKGHAGW